LLLLKVGVHNTFILRISFKYQNYTIILEEQKPFVEINREVILVLYIGKFSFLKNSFYLILIALHALIFAIFIYQSTSNFVFIIISIISSTSLILLALYTFFTSKFYYYYFYIGIIICGIPITFTIPMVNFLVIPELTIFLISLFRWIDSGSYYYKMKANKNPNLLHHDPATFNLFSRVSVKSGRMDEVWDPGNTSLKQLSISKNTISRIDKINVAPSMIIITLCFIFLFFFSVSISFF
jgi:hypothetical protein